MKRGFLEVSRVVLHSKKQNVSLIYPFFEKLSGLRRRRLAKL